MTGILRHGDGGDARAVARKKTVIRDSGISEIARAVQKLEDKWEKLVGRFLTNLIFGGEDSLKYRNVSRSLCLTEMWHETQSVYVVINWLQFFSENVESSAGTYPRLTLMQCRELNDGISKSKRLFLCVKPYLLGFSDRTMDSQDLLLHTLRAVKQELEQRSKNEQKGRTARSKTESDWNRNRNRIELKNENVARNSNVSYPTFLHIPCLEHHGDGWSFFTVSRIGIGDIAQSYSHITQ